MKKIPLSQGKFAIVDDDDFERVSKFKWYFTHGYARSNKIYLHRFILNAKKGQMVDHKNLLPLDCRKKNLRFCNKAQNSWNRTLIKTNTSGFKGVSWDKNKRKWESYIWKNNKKINLGFFLSKTEAAKIYHKAAKKLFGEYARLK